MRLINCCSTKPISNSKLLIIIPSITYFLPSTLVKKDIEEKERKKKGKDKR
jgi:hypothetical protein